MGKGSEWIEASSGNYFGSCQTHNVGLSPPKDRSGTAGAVGEGQGWEEEGGLATVSAIPRSCRDEGKSPKSTVTVPGREISRIHEVVDLRSGIRDSGWVLVVYEAEAHEQSHRG
jgi:hypothetical protein